MVCHLKKVERKQVTLKKGACWYRKKENHCSYMGRDRLLLEGRSVKGS